MRFGGTVVSTRLRRARPNGSLDHGPQMDSGFREAGPGDSTFRIGGYAPPNGRRL